MYAVDKGDIYVVKMLLDHGAVVELRSKVCDLVIYVNTDSSSYMTLYRYT